jgi:hypothetical protein
MDCNELAGLSIDQFSIPLRPHWIFKSDMQFLFLSFCQRTFRPMGLSPYPDCHLITVYITGFHFGYYDSRGDNHYLPPYQKWTRNFLTLHKPGAFGQGLKRNEIKKRRAKERPPFSAHSTNIPLLDHSKICK